MIDALTVLSARRAYEFAADDLRLTVLTVKPIQEFIQQAFRFQIAQIGTPVATFGEVPSTVPPGMIFDYGLWPSPDGYTVPIRFIHVEARRIVIDVAGPSSAIPQIFGRVREIVQDIATTLQIVGERPPIGEPNHELDYSEVTFKTSWPVDRIFAPDVREVLARACGVNTGEDHTTLAPILFARPFAASREPFDGIVNTGLGGDGRGLQLAPRTGTQLEDQLQFSSAPLDSDAHVEYLKELDAALAGSSTLSPKSRAGN